MSTKGTNAAISRRASALIALLSVLLASLGVAGTAVAATRGLGLHAPFSPPWWVLIPAFVIASNLSIDFEFRREARSVAFSELPLAVGVVFVAPWFVVLAFVLAVIFDSVVLRRQQPLKLLFNVSVAVLEAGSALLVLSLAGLGDTPDYRLWLALFVGLLIGEAIGQLAMTAVMHWLGVVVHRAQMLPPLVASAATTLVFTCLAIMAVTSVWTEPLTILVIAALAGLLTVAYRGYRRLSAQQQSISDLYAFVKDLGPMTVDDPSSTAVVDTIRALLHARFLTVAICDSSAGCWRYLHARDPDDPEPDTELYSALTEENEPARAAAMQGRTSVDADRMATPLVGSRGLVGILTVTERLGDVRDFDMGDLRLLETVATELATALERGQLLADLGRAATLDPLTGLPNLVEACSRLNDMIENSPHGVLVAAVAVDSFREVNDTLGHEVGDDLLLEVTRRLTVTSPDALVGRIGGGRFAVAVPVSTSGGDPEMFGLGIRAQVEGGAQLGAVGTHVRLSVGCVRAPEHGTDAATLMRRAETAMYGARHVHGGPVLWEPAYEVEGQRRLAVVTALREGLASGAIGLAFQPKIEVGTGRVTGVEALARWTHPALGAIRPDEFIPLAEASGLMGPLTSTVLRQALTACKGWQRRAPGAGVAVNVSADTVLDQAFVTEVAAILTSVGISPELLTLELTEGVVVADPGLASERMGELRSLGVKISVDDFGTGYSSLTYLKGLPVDEVKIDKGFVDGLVSESADRAVIRAVVDIAHTLGLRVVAEGVEHEEQDALLAQLGVDEVQGYLHGRPMAALDMAAWLRKRETARR